MTLTDTIGRATVGASPRPERRYRDEPTNGGPTPEAPAGAGAA